MCSFAAIRIAIIASESLATIRFTRIEGKIVREPFGRKLLLDQLDFLPSMLTRRFSH
jgi:hypothetical protein